MLRGRIDHPLTEAGRRQMWQAIDRRQTDHSKDELSGDNPELPWTEIISSPLQRCRSFADELSRQSGIPLIIQDHWQEIDYGDWDGMALSQWRQAAADQFRQFRKDVTALHPPNGEQFTQFSKRVLTAWRELLNRPASTHLLLITHGGVMRVLLPTVLGMPLNTTGVLDIPFACLSRVRVELAGKSPRAVLVGHNIGSQHRF